LVVRQALPNIFILVGRLPRQICADCLITINVDSRSLLRARRQGRRTSGQRVDRQIQSRHCDQTVLTPVNSSRLRISTQRQCCDLMTDKDRDILCCHKAVPRVVSVECAHTPVPSAVWLETTALVLVLQPIECPLSCPELPMYSRDCRFVVNGLYRPGKLALAVSQARERSRLWRAGPRNHDRLL
jgi:hypothetical protein